ncbi:DUF3320 domain-containing protein [Nocardioides sp. NPDC058538]|uniref:DUF3320 domain-containing protein n=1 Tax=Nocardioides sp. NPDC058538 TaxID=3346542 RepID=UPI003660935C
MHLTDHERFGRGLALLRDALRPFVDANLGRDLPPSTTWPDLIVARTEARLGRAYKIDPNDPRVLLRVMRDEWRGFKPSLSRVQTGYASELHDTANRWAHSPEMTAHVTDRGIDTMILLAESIGASEYTPRFQELLATTSAQDTKADERIPSTSDTGAPNAPVDGERARSGGAVRALPKDSLPDGVAQIAVAIGDLEVRLSYRASFNYAMVMNQIPVILGVEVCNVGTAQTDPGPLEISVHGWPSADDVRPLILETMPLGPGQSASIPSERLRWFLSPALFAHLQEAVTAGLRLRLDAHDAEASEPVTLLAADEWDATSVPETLAAFARPRDPSITALLEEVSTRLATSTGSPDIDGYQRGPDRACAIVQAIYEAMQARRIRYIEPPASFEGTGQKIRTHKEVLEDRWGTCLDLATTFAAALEAAGISPVLVLTTGHAFAGWLTQENHLLPATALSERSTLLMVADSADFVSVELTALTDRAEPVPFPTASAQTSLWWSRRTDDLRWMLDVKAAHRRVKPLPVLVSGEGGTIEVVETIEATRELRVPKELSQMPSSEFPPRVDQWRRSLLDLSNMNPLLNLSPRRTGGAGIHVPRGRIGDFEDRLAAGTAFRLQAHDDLSELHLLQGARFAQDIDADVAGRLMLDERTLFITMSDKEHVNRLVRLQRRARTELEETGTNNLYLTLGSVVFSAEATAGPSRFGAKATETAAPIFLLPVKLEGKRDTSFQIVVEDVDSTAMPNQCLAEKLRSQFGVEVPELIAPDRDDSGIDVIASMQAIRSALNKNGIKGIHVEEDAHLGVFQFATLEMWRDLTDNWRKLIERPVVRHLVERPQSVFDDDTQDPDDEPTAEATTYLPIAADGSQLKAVRWAAAGKSFVLEGPPGTGKSQTITNLIANCLAEGKKVLFVAEKQAALDVVQRRLDAVGLGPFTLDLHGRKQTAAAVRRQLTEALETRTSTSASFTTLRDSYRSVVESLSKYPDQLHEAGPTGESAWGVRQALLELEKRGTPSRRPLSALPEVGRRVIREGNEPDLYSRARDLEAAVTSHPGAPLDSPWTLSGQISVHAETTPTLRHATTELLAADRAAHDDHGRALLDLAMRPSDFERIADWLQTVTLGSGRSTAEARSVVTAAWRQRVQETASAIDRFRTTHLARLGPFTPTVIEMDLDGLVARSVEVDGKLFKKKPRQALIDELSPTLSPAANINPKTLTAQLRTLLTVREEAAELTRFVSGLAGVELPFRWNPLEDDAVEVVRRQVDAVFAASALADHIDNEARLDATTSTMIEAAARGLPVGPEVARRLARAWTQIFTALRTTDSTITQWQQDRSLSESLARVRRTWEKDLEDDFLALARWTAVSIAAGTLAEAGMGGLAEAALRGEIPGQDIEYAAMLSFARASLDERLDGSGLRFFDEEARSHQVERFLTTGVDLRERLRSELPARIVAARSFDPRRPQGRVADFLGQLGRKRGGMTTRALMRNFGSIITELTPCVMMSPGSVARFLEPGAVDFDIVVFDEASQIRVPDAVGAMGRGKAVVVVGDSQQMPPSSAFQSSGPKDDDEGTSDAPSEEVFALKDEVSILEQATQSRLPSLPLTWHYRSRNEALIAFSNAHYYKNQLASFPSPPDSDDSTGLSLRRVNGTWEGGTRGARVNRAEAEAVVREVRTVLARTPEKSVGVITFNNQQQTLILDMLEALAADGDRGIRDAFARDDEPLVVKNLENVQGDERDIILFTLAFGVSDKTGKVTNNWGPLSREGGEKRLNVAITRAKERVILFSSFEADQLDASTTSKGLQHLRSYLIQARDGAEAAGLDRRPPVDLHLDAVAAALEEAGLETRKSVGLSDFTVDLGVRSGTRPWVAVLLDGPGWRNRATVGDRDGMPHEVLVDAMSWSGVERVWLPTWLRDPQSVVERIVVAARTSEPRSVVALEPMEVVDDDSPVLVRGVDDVPEMQLFSMVKSDDPFEAADAKARHPRWALDHLEYADNKRTVTHEIQDIVRTEGPILADRLARVLAARFGLERVRQTRADEILALVPRGMIRRAGNGDKVAWPSNLDENDYAAFRVPTAGRRSVEDVPYPELRNAMIAHARAAHGMRDADLMRATARTFGIQQLGSKVAERLMGVLTAAVKSGDLGRDGDHVVALTTRVNNAS